MFLLKSVFRYYWIANKKRFLVSRLAHPVGSMSAATISTSVYKIFGYCFLDTLIQEMSFWIIDENNVRGDLPDISTTNNQWVWRLTQTFFQRLDWTTNGLSTALNAPVHTIVSARDDSIIRGPTVLVR